MKIVFAASEAAPYIKTGGLGDVGQALPKALASEGHTVKVVLPLYEAVKDKVTYFEGLTFVLTGTLPTYKRNEAAARAIAPFSDSFLFFTSF